MNGYTFEIQNVSAKLLFSPKDVSTIVLVQHIMVSEFHEYDKDDNLNMPKYEISFNHIWDVRKKLRNSMKFTRCP